MDLIGKLPARIGELELPEEEASQAVNQLLRLIFERGLPEVLPTDQAAKVINRKPQTLRKWACYENGPIRPIRINGRLAWRVDALMRLLNGEVQK